MANLFYTATGAPVAQARGASSSIRAEFTALQAGFDKIPSPATLVSNNATLGIDSGAANAYVVASSAQIIALTDGMEVVFKASNVNTGAATVNVNALGVKAITRPDGSALGAADIVAGQYIAMRYSLTAGAFQVTSGISAPNTAAAANAALAASLLLPQAYIASSMNGGPLAGFRNVLHNGCMRIAQRALPVLGGYGVDRWFVNSAGANLSISTYGPAANMPTNQSSIVLTLNGVAGNTDSNVEQRIEAANSRHLAGKTVTVSYWIYQTSGVTKNITIGFAYANALDNFGAIIGGVNSSSQAIPTATWTKVTFTTVLSAAGINGIRLTISAGIGAMVAGQNISIGEVQLELGSVATPFEQRPIGVELALCQRCYQPTKASLAGYTTAGCTNQYQGSFSIPMRASPTYIPASSSNTNTTGAVLQAVDANTWQHSSTGVAAGGFISSASGAFSADL